MGPLLRERPPKVPFPGRRQENGDGMDIDAPSSLPGDRWWAGLLAHVEDLAGGYQRRSAERLLAAAQRIGNTEHSMTIGEFLSSMS